jgi:hypothetical protein
MPPRTAGSEALSLDLSRLKQIASRLGCEEAGGFGTREKLRRINRALGGRLANGGADERSTSAQVVVEADSSLPVEIRTPNSAVDIDEVDRLRRDGCLDLGQGLSSAQASEVERHLRPKPLFIGHAPRRSDGQVPSIDDVPRDRNFACYDYLDLWSSPHLLEFASQDRMLDLVQGYLGCTPTLCSLNAYWALPERSADSELQAFHRDLDDYRSLVVFTLLTPVEVPEEGGHFYVEKSHDPALLEASLRAEEVGTKLDYLLAGPFVAPMTMRLFGRSARRFKGPAGASLCADGFGLHRSVVPRSRPKLLLELRFGTFFNERVYDLRLSSESGARRAIRRVLSPLLRVGSVFDQTRREQAREILRRLPDTPRHRYVFRYMLRELSAEL